MSASKEKKLRKEARAAGTDKKAIAAAEQAKAKLNTRRKRIAGIIAGALLLILLCLPNLPVFYTGTTAVRVGDETFSPAELSYFYATEYYKFANTYGQYAAYLGLDTSAGIQGLAAQQFSEDESWRDYFMDIAVNNLVELKVFGDYAEENGIVLEEAEIAALDSSIEETRAAAKAYGFANLKAFFEYNYGKGVSEKVVRAAGIATALNVAAREHLAENFSFTQEELDEYYDSLNGNYDRFSYSYYLVSAEKVESTGEDGQSVSAPTEKTMAAAKIQADEILAAYSELEGDDYNALLTEAASSIIEGASVTENSDTLGSSLPADYADFLKYSGRKAGDIAVLENTGGTGYYVVVFEGRSVNNYNVINVRHILIMAEADGNGEYSEEALAAAKVRAEELYAQWQAGEATEESFAALANEYSEDGGSNTRGGLYENVAKGQMVEEFDAFCFDPARKSGDSGIVYGSSGSYAGYHIMYFVGEGDLYRNILALNDLRGNAVSEWLAEKTAGLKPEISFFARFAGK